jgi:hypothetical protein
MTLETASTNHEAANAAVVTVVAPVAALSAVAAPPCVAAVVALAAPAETHADEARQDAGARPPLGIASLVLTRIAAFLR